MANLAINDTDKGGWIVIYMNDYYPTSTMHAEHWIAKENLRGLDLITTNGEDGCELYVSHEPNPVLISFDVTDSFFKVDTVNGVAATSNDDLRDKILALLVVGAIGGGLTDAELRATPISVSGTVTANAGTNLNTSALALEAGGNLASIKAKTDNIPPLGQALAAASTPVVLTAAQITTLTPPAAITGFNLEATQTAMSAKLPATLGQKAMTASMAVVLASDQASVPVVATPITITKGTQGATGFTVQRINDAGRNSRHFMLDAYTAAPLVEAVQSVVQWFGNAAVAGTTQPAVVTAGKTLRLTNYTISTKSLATVGSAVVRIRANTAGLGVLASPLVFSMECGSRAGATTVAMTGGMDTFSGVFPEGLEFPAGTGLAFSMAGYGPTGTLLLEGATRFQVFGYEY